MRLSAILFKSRSGASKIVMHLEPGTSPGFTANGAESATRVYPDRIRPSGQEIGMEASEASILITEL